MTYYGYIHCTPEGVPFYVGAGTLRRMRSTRKTNPGYRDVREQHGWGDILKGGLECSDKDTAYVLERGLIKCLTRSGIELTNLAAGGRGTTSPVPETRARMSASAKRRGPHEAARLSRLKGVRGVHIDHGVREWESLTAAAQDLKVSISAIYRAIRKGQRSKGWKLEYVM